MSETVKWDSLQTFKIGAGVCALKMKEACPSGTLVTAYVTTRCGSLIGYSLKGAIHTQIFAQV
jgi:hypothetical protein